MCTWHHLIAQPGRAACAPVGPVYVSAVATAFSFSLLQSFGTGGEFQRNRDHGRDKAGGRVGGTVTIAYHQEFSSPHLCPMSTDPALDHASLVSGSEMTQIESISGTTNSFRRCEFETGSGLRFQDREETWTWQKSPQECWSLWYLPIPCICPRWSWQTAQSVLYLLPQETLSELHPPPRTLQGFNEVLLSKWPPRLGEEDTWLEGTHLLWLTFE